MRMRILVYLLCCVVWLPTTAEAAFVAQPMPALPMSASATNLTETPTPIEPQAHNGSQKLTKKQLRQQLRRETRGGGMFPNSMGWAGLVMFVIGLFIMLIFGGTIGTVGSVLAAVGIILVLVWIVQRLAYY